MNYKKIKLIPIFLLLITIYSTLDFAHAVNKLSISNNANEAVTKQITNDSIKTIEKTATTPESVSTVNREEIASKNSGETNNQTLRKEIQEYKNALDISPTVMVRIRVVTKLIERKNTDEKNFQKITRVSKIIQKVEDKEVLAEELLGMDKKFVNRFSHDIENRPRVKQQINNYIQLVKLKKKVRVQIRKIRIEQLFNKQLTIDDFINQVWNDV